MQGPIMKTYQKLCTEFYDLEQHPHGEQALAFYMEQARKADGPILEPMCGSGRFLIPMLKAGFDVEGFDASPFMLDSLRKKYAQISSNVAPVSQQFVQDFTSERRYQLIFIPYGSFGLITNYEDIKKSLLVLQHYLLPGGKCFFEIETVASVLQPCGVWRRGVNSRSDGSKIALSFITSYDQQTQLFQSFSRYELLEHDIVQETEEETFQQYLYRFDELDELLRDSGFMHIKKYSAFEPTQAATPLTPIVVYECEAVCD